MIIYNPHPPSPSGERAGVKGKEKMNFEIEEATDLVGKAVLITGGTTGIGRSLALRLARAGAKIVVFGRHEKELGDALSDIGRINGGEAWGITADVANAEDVKKVFALADAKMGGVEILINNAALPAGSIVETDYKEWKYVLDANLGGYMACSQEAVKRMREKGAGHIINIGSLSAEVYDGDSDVYVATKSGVRGFTFALKKKVGGWGIKVSLIEPGLIGTDLNNVPPAGQRDMERQGKMLKAEDIACLVHFVLVQPQRTDIPQIRIIPHEQYDI